MARKTTQKAASPKKRGSGLKIFTFWRDMDPVVRRRWIQVAGLLLAAFTVFTLLATVSYPFTWKADQSLLGDPDRMDLDVDVNNFAGKAGARWSYLLMARWFGVGSYALVLTLAILAARMIFGRRSFSVIKAVLLTITGAVLVSMIGGFVSGITNAQYALGGGYGGDCGRTIIEWSRNLFGYPVTGLFIAVLLALWFICASTRFSKWFGGLAEESVHTQVSEEAPVQEVETEEPEEGKLQSFLGGLFSRKKGENEEDTEEPEQKTRKTFTWAERQEPKPPVEETTQTASPATSPLYSPVSDLPVTEPQPKPSIRVPQVSTPDAGQSSATDSVQTVAGTETLDPEQQIEVIGGEELSTEVVEDLPRINVRDELKNYRFPPLELLEEYEGSRQEVSSEELKRNNFRIRAALKTYKIDVDNVKAVVGPTVTLYKVYPAPGVKISAIRALQDDIAMALHAKGVRVVTLADSVGIEVANDNPSIVPLLAMLNDSSFRESKAELPVAIGFTITQKVKVFDLADAPHLLVAGATKQGKSVGLNVLISSLLYSKHPSELKFVFIDPKMVEFSAYARLLKHYLAVLPTSGSEQDEFNNSIAKTPQQAELLLKSLCIEMDERYALLSKALVNNVKLYNEKYKDRHLLPTDGHKYLPYIVVVVDEYADLTMSVGASGDSKAMARSISTSIIRLAQKGRAAGIHVVLATQRPSVDVITGLIKSNFPTRIAFRVFSNNDSRTILDSPGAEKLIGKGDMIYYAGVDMERIQCAYISNDEINAITSFIGEQTGYMKSYNTPYYLPAPEPDSAEDGVGMLDMKNLDERFEDAAKLVVTTQRGSTSDLQRRLGMGYAKAGRVMDQLEAAGIVGPQSGSKPREVLVSDLDELQRIIDAFRNQ
ncbi:MAG: DNA translocase FtsK 4TM domain-containing protein [Bacteroidales bacterium]|nr:DNA translocase FtsK 4TM domain-containing protein [Bacteroidales bacterium]